MKKILITLNDQGGEVISWNYDGIANTLREQSKQHEPIVVLQNEEDIDREEVL